jgi:hypothetical protein
MKPEILAEQILERRVMHVDFVRIGKIDTDGAERIEIARVLLEPVAHRLFGIPIDLLRQQLAAVRIEDVDPVLGQIIGLRLHLRDQVAAHDRDRRSPVWIEIDLDDPALDVGRRPIGLADHRGVTGDHGVVLHGLDLGGRGPGRLTRRRMRGRRPLRSSEGRASAIRSTPSLPIRSAKRRRGKQRRSKSGGF